MKNNERSAIPSKKEATRILMKAGFSPDTIRQCGVWVLYRGYLAQQRPGTTDQACFLKCDADSQDSQAAIADLQYLRDPSD